MSAASKMLLKNQQTAFLALVTSSLLIGWRPLYQTFALSWRNDEYTQILLILPISAALIFLHRQTFRTLSGWRFRTGLVLLIAAVAIACSIWFMTYRLPADERLALEMFALVLWWIGSFSFCFGTGTARGLMFPLLLLFGLVPLPDAALNGLIALLQDGSAWSAHALFAAFGVPVVQHGIFLTIPNLTIQIAQECSSIRSSSMLFITTLVLAQLLLQSPWKRMLVIFLSIPLSVAKNGLRIFTIAMLGTRVDPGYLTGRLHHQGGILFFLIALVATFALIGICQRGESAREASRSDAAKVVITGH
jgi:exosortase